MAELFELIALGVEGLERVELLALDIDIGQAAEGFLVVGVFIEQGLPDPRGAGRVVVLRLMKARGFAQRVASNGRAGGVCVILRGQGSLGLEGLGELGEVVVSPMDKLQLPNEFSIFGAKLLEFNEHLNDAIGVAQAVFGELEELFEMRLLFKDRGLL